MRSARDSIAIDSIVAQTDMCNDSLVARVDSFETVKAIGLTLPGVEAATRYDGSPVLKIGGAFMAGMATHPSAEPGTLVVRADCDDRERLLEDAPETYYVTDYYRKYPVVLARLSRLDASALRDVLAMSRRLTLPKARLRRAGNQDADRRSVVR